MLQANLVEEPIAAITCRNLSGDPVDLGAQSDLIGT